MSPGRGGILAGHRSERVIGSAGVRSYGCTRHARSTRRPRVKTFVAGLRVGMSALRRDRAQEHRLMHLPGAVELRFLPRLRPEAAADSLEEFTV